MSTILSIDLAADEGNKLLARVDDTDVLIGRAPAPKGVAIQSMAISSTHGKFIRFNEHWFYRDLQSTNGSWFSSRMLSPNAFHIVKDNDTLVIANTPIQLRLRFDVTDDEISRLEEPAIYIFWQDRLKVVLPLPRHNQQYIIGGEQSILELPANFLASNKLVLRADGRNCIFESHLVSSSVYHNSTQISPSAQVLMQDRDNIITSQIVIIFSSGHANVKSDGSMDEEVGTFIDPSARYSKKLINNSAFGKLLENENETRDIVRTHGIVRPIVQIEADPHNLIGDKIIYLIGIASLLATVGLLFWFLIN